MHTWMPRLSAVLSIYLSIIAISSITACSSDTSLPSDATLSALSLSSGTLDQVFQYSQTEYTSTVGFLNAGVTVNAITSDPLATLTINGVSPVTGNNAKVDIAEGATTTITIVVTAQNNITTETYTIDVSRQSLASFAQTTYAKASNTGMGDAFGQGIAISGDTMAIGAINEASAATGIDGNQADDSAYASGAVYVLVRNNSGTWEQQAYIKASNADSPYEFGASLALDGDTLVVGSPGEDSAADGIDGDQVSTCGVSADNCDPGAGAVYVFTRDAPGLWVQEAYIKAGNNSSYYLEQFGVSVALDGNTLVVGAPGEGGAATGVNGDSDCQASMNCKDKAGAAYVFERSEGVWQQQAYIKASNTDIGDMFGTSVALSGDLLAVGAPEEQSDATGIDGNQDNNPALSEGAVYTFTRSGGSWQQEAYIKAGYTNYNGKRFGASLALAGDTLLVGAPGDDTAASGVNGNETDDCSGATLNCAYDSGAAYVFVRSNDGVWSRQAYLKAGNPNTGDVFGTSVAISENTILVGATDEDSAATGINGNDISDCGAGNTNCISFSGAAYVFTRKGDTWSQSAYIKPSNPHDGFFYFGASVAIGGDTMVVGGPGESSAATGIDGNQISDCFGAQLNCASGSGAAYIFR